MRPRAIVALACAASITAACTSGGSTGSTTAPVSPSVPPTSAPPTPPPPALAIPMSLTNFGSLPDVPLVTTGTYPGPETPRTLTGVDMSDGVAAYLSLPGVREALQRRGFVVIPGGNPSDGYRQFFHLYAVADHDKSTVYVTSDAGYHHWHLIFDKVLRSLEQDVFLPKLETLTTGMLANATKQARTLEGAGSGPAARQVLSLLQVEATLLELPVGTLTPEAQKESALIRAHAEIKRSPILGTDVDYSLYTPRGHYTRTAALTRFFLGMSLLGQTPFAVDPGTPAKLRPAVLAARTFLPSGMGSKELLSLWRDIYEPTAFLVGAADDYTPVELDAVLRARMPGAMSHPNALTDAVLREVANDLLDLRQVMVDPEAPAVRLMGTRFVLDAWIMDQLLYPNVGTETKPRVIASAIDVASAWGSPLANKIQKQTGQFDFRRFGHQLSRMRNAVGQRPEEAWSGTVYDSWLWALEPMWTPHTEAFPDYMRSGSWTAKALQSGLGSFAELRHDTILYVKQATGEGDAPLPTYVPRHWVEPDPVAFARLAAVADLMREGLAGRDLLTTEADGLLTDLAELESFFARIARDELDGEPISDEDNQRLAAIAHEFEGLWWRTSDQGRFGQGSLDDDSAIIADISRGFQQVVEIGTGRVEPILVIVPDDRGGFQLAIGAVYSYYEFLQPLSDRLTDEAWRQMLDSGNAPERPAWEDAFLPG
jgi:hypothetical protein